MSIVSPQIEVFEPFSSNTDASRTNMSSKQLLQVIVAEGTEIPYILNKNYKVMTTVNSPFVKIAEEDGVVIYNNNNLIGYVYKETKRITFEHLPDTKKMVNNSLTLKYITKEPRFKKGDVLWDYTNQDHETNMPRTGYRANIMYSSFFGFNADDAMVISESFAERCRIDYSEKIFMPITPEIKYIMNEGMNKYLTGQDEITPNSFYIQYNKIDTSKHFLTELINVNNSVSKSASKMVETIAGGKILSLKIHKLSDLSFDELKARYVYTPTLIDEIESLYDDQAGMHKHIQDSLRLYMQEVDADAIHSKLIKNYYSVTAFNDIFMTDLADNYKIDKGSIDIVIELEIHKDLPTCTGDKFTNLFAGKGVVSLILPDELMPRDEANDPADIIFNPLGLFGRNNWGTVFEMALAKIIEDVEENISNRTQTIRRLKFINKHFIRVYDEDYYHNVEQLIENFEEVFDEFKHQVQTKGFFLYVENFPKMSYNDFINNFVNPYEATFNVNITKKEKTIFSKELMQFMRDKGFKTTLFNSAQDIEQDVYFGRNYYMKLFHTAWSKYNAVGFSSSYSRITGQPARGRKNKGGLHISWQTFAALLGYKTKNAVLKEFYSIKADVAISDKKIFINSFISNGEYILKNKYFSQTKQTLTNALKMIGMIFKGD
jgi:DNA-directed RNA polymerase beta subunit